MRVWTWLLTTMRRHELRELYRMQTEVAHSPALVRELQHSIDQLSRHLVIDEVAAAARQDVRARLSERKSPVGAR